MSKTVELQVEKTRDLIEGLRKHLNGKGDGVTQEEITSLEQGLEELAHASSEVERLREELNPKVKHMNDVLAQVKRVFAEKKKILKGFYPQESWGKYGIHDKR